MDHPGRNAIDIISVSTVVATIAGWLPAIAALLTLVWTAIRIYETKTVQRFLRRRKQRKVTNVDQ